MAQYKFLSAYNATESPMTGGQLIKAFSAGEVIEGTFRTQQLTQWGMSNVNWVDTVISGRTVAIPANILQQVSIASSIGNIPAPVKGLFGLAAILIFLKVVKVI